MRRRGSVSFVVEVMRRRFPQNGATTSDLDRKSGSRISPIGAGGLSATPLIERERISDPTIEAAKIAAKRFFSKPGFPQSPRADHWFAISATVEAFAVGSLQPSVELQTSFRSSTTVRRRGLGSMTPNTCVLCSLQPASISSRHSALTRGPHLQIGSDSQQPPQFRSRGPSTEFPCLGGGRTLRRS